MCDINAIRRDAVAAALIHLACCLEAGTITRDDGDIGAILTNDGTHAGLSIYELRELAQKVLEEGKI